MYEIGSFIGAGSMSLFFHVRGHDDLGIFIPWRLMGQNRKQLLKAELKRIRIIEKTGLPIPEYKGIVDVKIHDHIRQSLVDAGIEERWQWNYLEHLRPGAVVKGLLAQKIDHDISLVSTERAVQIHREYEEEMKTRFGIIMKDSYVLDAQGKEVFKNVLWSKKYARLYFIDFELWTIPWKYQFVKPKNPLPPDFHLEA